MGMNTQRLVQLLRKEGVEARHRYLEPLYRQLVLVYNPNFGSEYRDLYLPNAEKICGKVISLPNHPLLTSKDLATVIKVIKQVV